MTTHNNINWFEIPCADIDRATRFYEAMLGLKIPRSDFMGVPHGVLPAPEGSVTGALVLDPHNVASSSGTRLYLDAHGDLKGCLKRAVETGGKVVLGLTEIGEMGTIAIIDDSEGNRVGLHQPKAR